MAVSCGCELCGGERTMNHVRNNIMKYEHTNEHCVSYHIIHESEVNVTNIITLWSSIRKMEGVDRKWA
jgi:hypothetical protein